MTKYEENQEKKENPTKLTSDEKAEVFKLKAIDSKIKAHEMAHKSGPAASGGATYSYTKGPDGLMYAIAGEVPVEIKQEILHKRQYQICMMLLQQH